MTVIYIDVLFLINLFVNYFLLLAVKLISKSTVRRWRILLGSILGAIYSCLMFYPTLWFIYTTVFKILFSILTVVIVFGYKSLRNLAFKSVMFITFTVFFGGIMLLLDLIFSPKGLIYNNGIIYIDISPVTLVIASAICYFIFFLLSRIFSRQPSSSLYPVTANLFGKTVNFYAIADSGNMLKDLLTCSSVIVADFNKIKSIIPENAVETFKNGEITPPPSPLKEKFAVIPFESIGGRGILPAFRPDEIYISGKKTDKKVIIAVTAKSLKTSEYSALISTELI